MTGQVIVIGVGNQCRRDDGAGPAVIEALSGHVPGDTLLTVSDGEPGRMLGLWRHERPHSTSHGADTSGLALPCAQSPMDDGSLFVCEVKAGRS
jgi:hypothetical protein